MHRDKTARRKASARAACVALLVCLLAVPPPVAAWDNVGQRLITTKAIDALPFPLRVYFRQNSRALVQLATNPSQWGDNAPSNETNYIYLDRYGDYPFAELPRDYNRAVRKFKRGAINANGTLPWTIGTYSLQLEEAFRNQQWDDVKLYAAILARYVAEAHDPFNTTSDASGAASGQDGVAGRYTRTLVNKYRMFFIINPSGAYKVADPTAQAFGMVMEAHTWVDNILLADARARSGKVDYGTEYEDDFYNAAGHILLRQLTSASTDVASYWYTAWVNAGRPPLPVR